MTAPSDRYTHGHHASVVGQHARRTAEREAAYLLPRLQPGMRLLDVGCGPGTITTGLARAVAPGETVGIEVVPDVLVQAREHAASEGVTNVRFEEASVYALPYADVSFDVAHAHQVLQHLTKPEDAAREVLRVLKPGGLFAVRDADYATGPRDGRPRGLGRPASTAGWRSTTRSQHGTKLTRTPVVASAPGSGTPGSRTS